MINPGPATKTASSSFLTSPAGAGYAQAAASLAPSLFGSDSVNFRGKYARNKLKHDQKIWAAQQKHHLSTIGPNFAEKMKAVDAAGLHRLAALGISTGGSPAPGSSTQPMIPGQSPDFGSAISEGIQTAQNVSRGNQLSAQAKTMANLKVEEQHLRNDWLRTQIANSKMKTLTTAANANQDAIKLNALKGSPHTGEVIVGEQPPIPHTGTSSGYSLFGPDTIKQKPGVVRGQALEDAVGEIPAAVISPFQFLQDVGYTLDQLLHKRSIKEKSKSDAKKGRGRYRRQ